VVLLLGNPRGSQAVAEAEALKANLRFTQSRAMCDLPGNSWSLLILGSTYTILKNGFPPNPSVNLPGSNSGTYTLPSGLTINPALSLIIFNSRGQPVNLFGNPLAVNSTLTISGASAITITKQTGFIQ
jgi:hypothetical protein